MKHATQGLTNVRGRIFNDTYQPVRRQVVQRLAPVPHEMALVQELED